MKNLIVVLFLWGVGFCHLAEANTDFIINSRHLSLAEAQQAFRQEIERIRPVLPKERQDVSFNACIDIFPSSLDDGDILLFAAAELTNYKFARLWLDFPILTFLYHVQFIGDLDQDGTPDILSVFQENHADIRLSVFTQASEAIHRYDYTINNPLHEGMKIVVQGRDILAKIESRIPIRIEGLEDQVATLVRHYLSEIRFTGNGFDVTRPFFLQREWILLD